MNEITPENIDSQSVSPDIPAIQTYWEDGPPALVEDLEELITYIRSLEAQRDAAVAILREPEIYPPNEDGLTSGDPAEAEADELNDCIWRALAALGADVKAGY